MEHRSIGWIPTSRAVLAVLGRTMLLVALAGVGFGLVLAFTAITKSVVA